MWKLTKDPPRHQQNKGSVLCKCIVSKFVCECFGNIPLFVRFPGWGSTNLQSYRVQFTKLEHLRNTIRSSMNLKPALYQDFFPHMLIYLFLAQNLAGCCRSKWSENFNLYNTVRSVPGWLFQGLLCGREAIFGTMESQTVNLGKRWGDFPKIWMGTGCSKYQINIEIGSLIYLVI